ncbi:MAG: AIR synthase family protein [Candidatus Bathyarchaeia archaeon]|jgi:hydrogenase maturation factor
MAFFRTGKIPTEVLVRSVFRYKGARDRSVILGSSVGEDAALVSLGKNVLVLTTDPVTGTASDIGWLAVHVNANDVACRGARPKWFLCDLLLPERSNAALVDRIMKQIDKAAKGIGVAVVGGHTEVTPGLKRPIVIGYMVGVVSRKKYVTSHSARPQDQIIMTKTVGIEGTSVLATDFARKLRKKIGPRSLRRAKDFRNMISVVDDALIAARAGGVKAMHDPTEGGLLQGVWELAEASHVGFMIQESRIAIRSETREICSALRVDPLRLMSSGCLLIVAEKRKSRGILRSLRKHRIPARIIGTVTPRGRGRKLVGVEGSVREVAPSERDELYRVIESYRAG